MEKENISTEHRPGDDIKFKTKIDISNGNNSTFCRNETEKERPLKEIQVSTEVAAPSVGNVFETDILEKSTDTEKVRKRIQTENKPLNNNYNSTGSLNTITENIQEKANLLRDIVQALLVRVFLFIHSCLCVWRAADVQKDDIYWLLAFTNILLGIEAFYTCFFRKGRDPKWICPCFLLYLLGTVPAIWILQLDVLERNFNVNMTSNSTAEELSAFYGVKLIPISLDADTWASVLQQLLLFVLVIGRMLLPRGHLTHDELSQTLFIFIGAGSDVMEFFVVFEDVVFYNNTGLKYATLIIWSLSLLQFIFVIAVAKGPKRFRMGTMTAETEGPHKHFGTELWGLLLSIIFMDLPYFALRLYAIVAYEVLNYGILFFTCKNALMLVLLSYRLIIVVVKIKSERKDATKKQQNLDF
eukprot:XP_011424702.1 PREDICTED: transmembrane protein 26-like [Crassostrea gigas]